MRGGAFRVLRKVAHKDDVAAERPRHNSHLVLCKRAPLSIHTTLAFTRVSQEVRTRTKRFSRVMPFVAKVSASAMVRGRPEKWSMSA